MGTKITNMKKQMNQKAFFIRNKFSILISLLFIMMFISHCEEKKKEEVKREQLFVSADEGLKLLTEPNSKAKLISTLAYGTPVGVLERTGKKETINNMDGEWIKIQTDHHTGYAFDGFLISYETFEENEEQKDLKPGDVKPFQFSIIGNKFSYGKNCSGLTYSEYSIELQFTGDSVKKEYNSMDDASIEAVDSEGNRCIGTLKSIKVGKFSSSGKNIKIDYTVHQTYTTNCKGIEKLTENESIQETETLEPVSCRGKNALRVSADGEPDFFYTIVR